MANPYLESLQTYGGSLGTASRHAGRLLNSPLLNNPAVKTIGRYAGPAFAGLSGYWDYEDGIKKGENPLRAGLGATAEALSNLSLVAPVPLPFKAAGFVGSKLLGWGSDRAFEAFTEDDGLKPGTEAYKKHYAGLLPQAQADYNNDPTPEKKQKLQQVYANATGTSAPLKASDAVDSINGYNNFLKNISRETELFKVIDEGQRSVTGFGARDYLDPNSQYNNDIRNLEHKYALINEQMARRAGIFGTTQEIAKEGARKSLSAVSDGANIATKFYGRGY